MPVHNHFLVLCVILTSKVGQVDLFFGVKSGFISRSVHARLQVSVYDGDYPDPHTHRDNI